MSHRSTSLSGLRKEALSEWRKRPITWSKVWSKARIDNDRTGPWTSLQHYYASCKNLTSPERERRRENQMAFRSRPISRAGVSTASSLDGTPSAAGVRRPDPG